MPISIGSSNAFRLAEVRHPLAAAARLSCCRHQRPDNVVCVAVSSTNLLIAGQDYTIYTNLW